MTIDEMICALYKENFTVRDTEAVIAALRAGQEMRDKFTVIYDARDDIYIATSVDFVGLGKSGKNWDAATKEDV